MKYFYFILLGVLFFACKDDSGDPEVAASTYKYFVTGGTFPVDYDYKDSEGKSVKGVVNDSGYVYTWKQTGKRDIGVSARANLNVITPQTATVRIVKDDQVIAQKTGVEGEWVELYGSY